MRRGMNNWGEFTYKSREGDEVGGFFKKKENVQQERLLSKVS